jgi:hypothetical protein
MICDKGEGVSIQITLEMNYYSYCSKTLIPFIRVIFVSSIVVGVINICNYKLSFFVIHLGEHYSKNQHVLVCV